MLLPNLFMRREYWEDEVLTYQCADMTLGLDASDDNVKTYKCKKDFPKGRYNTPRDEYNETWPICQTRTTTVKIRKLLTHFIIYIP